MAVIAEEAIKEEGHKGSEEGEVKKGEKEGEGSTRTTKGGKPSEGDIVARGGVTGSGNKGDF